MSGPLKIFISSPSDVADERVIAENVIAAVNVSCRDTLGIQTEAHTWKHLPPLTGLPENTIQKRINEEVRKCNVFVLLLYKRYGAIESGRKTSNTEREIEVALQMLAEDEPMILLSYFRELPPNTDRGGQEEKVRRLRVSLANRNIWFRAYQTPDEFRERFTHDLYHTILENFVFSDKQKALKRFWRFGTQEGITHPRLVIAYPPLDRYFMREEIPDKIWLKRLVSKHRI